MAGHHPQIPLQFPLRETFSFEHYIPGENTELISQLQSFINASAGGYYFIWGASGAGVSHLLQASCRLAEEAGLSSMYLPLDSLLDLSPELLEGLEGLDLICLDNLEAVCGNPKWEESLFHLFNRLFATPEQASRLLVGAHQPPGDLALELKDLKSRIGSGIVYEIKELTAADQLALIKKRADYYSIGLSDEVGQFIINRSGRDNHTLCDLIDNLDKASLSAQRKLTIPFIKSVTGW